MICMHPCDAYKAPEGTYSDDRVYVVIYAVTTYMWSNLPIDQKWFYGVPDDDLGIKMGLRIQENCLRSITAVLCHVERLVSDRMST